MSTELELFSRIDEILQLIERSLLGVYTELKATESLLPETASPP